MTRWRFDDDPDVLPPLPLRGGSLADLPLFGDPLPDHRDDPPPHTRARPTDPPTSHAAAEGSREAARRQRACILACLRQYGDMTADELDDRLNWRPTTAGRRLSELARVGLIRSTGATRPTRSGHAAEVYTAVWSDAA